MGRSLLSYGLLSLLVLLQQVVAQDATTTAATPQKSANTGYNGGEDNPQDPSDAGAAGASKGAFNLSKGGLAAIIVVAVLVGVIGIGSAVLFWLAKKRQWDVRQSIRRASRRLTGRSTVDVSSKRQNRRTGVRLNSPPRPHRKPEQERDLEKGAPHSGGQGTTKTTITSTFDVDTPTPTGWKASVLGGKK
ncbi:hypothetical protein K458DRAFT_445068 [Lentithecium fluviatile CBS 122367]|uniref:Mid2 domain-containing protein n=1 Tax=Lentithecium fluviatile CBS 122367 TaxID=1168545 RepID=A0A6G1ISM0_9PLEO|nr:hypothetical protein K458DRAFT_445068 [Lentithecium fluviatile CBS 122367]